MLTIIVLGFILFIGGVGFTILHDKHKERGVVIRAEAEAKAKVRAEAQASKKRSTENSQSLSSWFDHIETRSKPRIKPSKTSGKRVVKPGSEKTGYHKPTVSAEDVSINSTLTVQELIQKIESMKKK